MTLQKIFTMISLWELMKTGYDQFQSQGYGWQDFIEDH